MARGLICFFVLLGTLGSGCSKSSPPPEAEASSVAKSADAQATAQDVTSARSAGATRQKPPVFPLAAADATACRAPRADRMVAIGDLHGDLKATRRVLQLAGAIDDSDRWVGGALVVVQTGDVLDRGSDDRAVLALLDKEQVAAKKAGGAVYRLNGNHEIMNVQGDFRYVSENGLKAYASEPRTGRPDVQQLPTEAMGRGEAFLPGGREARRLAELPAVLIVGDTVFAHGGVEPKHVRYGIDRINRELGAWMRGEAPLPTALAGEHTPFWTRTYGEAPASDKACTRLDEVLVALKATRLVVGHTPQKAGITFDCNQKLARIDVGLSAYYGNNPTEALEITAKGTRVLRAATTADPR